MHVESESVTVIRFTEVEIDDLREILDIIRMNPSTKSKSLLTTELSSRQEALLDDLRYNL